VSFEDVRAELEDAARGTGWTVSTVVRHDDPVLANATRLVVGLRRARDGRGQNVQADSVEAACQAIKALDHQGAT